jgi:EPS-associated MarR family transcriptional regulator
MGVSLGKANYCLRALIEKGFVKFGRFCHNENKTIYAYLLTPAGIEEKTRIVRSFLQRKEAEYDTIQQEIAALRRDLPEAQLAEVTSP